MADALHAGFYCEHAQIWVVLPLDQHHPSRWNGNTVVGHPGFDGVEFQQARESSAVLAYYPNTDEIGVVAEDLDDLIRLWIADSIDYPF